MQCVLLKRQNFKSHIKYIILSFHQLKNKFLYIMYTSFYKLGYPPVHTCAHKYNYD